MLYDQIIVPFDGTREASAAAQIGADLSTLFDAPLLLLTSARTDQPHDLAQLKERAVDMTTDTVEVWVDSGSTPSAAVAAAVAHRENALVVMASHARTGVRRALFGSLVEDVLGAVDTPVLALGPRCDLRDPVDLRQAVLCVDASATAEAALTLAAAWTSALRLRALLLHVRVPDRGSDRRGDRGRGKEFDFSPLVSTLRGVCDDIETAVVDAPSVAEGITLAVQGTAPSVVVMATHGRQGLDRFAHGSVTADVVRASSVPVLVQRGTASLGLAWLQHGEGEGEA